jgi:CheY-like chemotaxis protein
MASRTDTVPTVLVAEDDVPILKLVTRILRDSGYHTIPARDGQEAWSIFQQADGSIDLVLADVMMPHMTGPELGAQIAAQRPDLPVILMSGFSGEDLTSRGHVLSHGHLLTEPFTPGDLLDLVRRLLPT